MRVDPHFLSAQIAALRLQFPELAEDEDAWSLTIESETDVPDVLARIERRRREALAMAGKVAGYIAGLGIADLEIRQARFERQAEAMRELAFKIMQMADVRKVELPETTFSIAAGQPKVVITDEAVLPDALCRITRSPNKTKIAEWLKTGTAVPGASLSNAEPHLTIRTR